MIISRVERSIAGALVRSPLGVRARGDAAPAISGYRMRRYRAEAEEVLRLSPRSNFDISEAGYNAMHAAYVRRTQEAEWTEQSVANGPKAVARLGAAAEYAIVYGASGVLRTQTNRLRSSALRVDIEAESPVAVTSAAQLITGRTGLSRVRVRGNGTVSQQLGPVGLNDHVPLNLPVFPYTVEVSLWLLNVAADVDAKEARSPSGTLLTSRVLSVGDSYTEQFAFETDVTAELLQQQPPIQLVLTTDAFPLTSFYQPVLFGRRRLASGSFTAHVEAY